MWSLNSGRMCYTPGMRYHKAAKITQSEADLIIANGGASLSDTVVISHGDKWYDVRSMTRAECEAFVADLARAEIAAQDEQLRLPN
jgi:hypothetical protein